MNVIFSKEEKRNYIIRLRVYQSLLHAASCVFSFLYFYLLLCDVEYVVAVLEVAAEVLANLQVGIALRICVTVCAE